jgi:hypothetical protein
MGGHGHAIVPQLPAPDFASMLNKHLPAYSASTCTYTAYDFYVRLIHTVKDRAEARKADAKSGVTPYPMDSPITHAPVGQQEKPILEKLLILRDKLLLLKQDKSTYVKSQDVLPLYEEIIEQIHTLNDVRGPDHLIQNRVDTVLDDCLQLISLFFMAVGRNSEAPGIYAVTSTITRLCEHLKEAAFYSKKDLDSLEHTISKMEETLDRSTEKYSPYLLTRIRYRLEICRTLLAELRDFLSTLSPEMVPTWEKLVSLLRSIAALNTRSKASQLFHT